MKLIASALGGACLLLAACGGPAAETAAPAPGAEPAAALATVSDPVPEAVNGWREYPLRDGVVSVQPAKWRTDVIDIPVAAGKGLEYKLKMSKGQGVVYNITYGTLEHPGMMEVEFHGHTEQVDGVGDLMYYSKTGGSPESGIFNAPWDGIHGWWLNNLSANDVTVRLEVAGFYELEDSKP